jgi:DNA-binding MarR family transcriptional regulator
MAYRLPLQELLTTVLRAYTAEFESELADAGFPDLSLALGTNVLRFLGTKGIRLTTVADLAGVSKQAVSQHVAYLEARGYLTVEADPTDRRAKTLRLTARGLESQRVARTLFSAIEQRWRRRLGTDEMRQLRVSLETAVTRLTTVRN